MRARPNVHPRAARRAPCAWRLAAAAGAIALAIGGCAAGPAPIAYDQDGCDFCLMQISDPRYGTELMTSTGKVHKFDSIECLASFYSSLGDSTKVRALWVSDYRSPGNFISAREAVFIHHEGPGSPMGRGLLALAAGSDVTDAGVPAGEALSWSQVVELVARESLESATTPPRHTMTSDAGSGAEAADVHQE